jgi:mannitol/fructose-specific phosphotransferase system IIA component (Ntr-type)
MLSDIFNLRSIKLNLEGKTKEMIFEELVDGIAGSNPYSDRAEMLAALWEREEKMNTGITSGVAIPHAFCKGIDNIAGAIGVSRLGIEYGALDNKPVHVVFLLAVSEHAKENHLRILNQILKLAQSEVINQIKNAKSAEDIHALLAQIRLTAPAPSRLEPELV